MEDSFSVAEIYRVASDVNGREIEFNLHVSACPRLPCDFQAEASENRLKLCFRQLIGDADSATTDSKVDMVLHHGGTYWALISSQARLYWTVKSLRSINDSILPNTSSDG